MNAERLLATLSAIGDEPDRILQLRKIVVALAISGKLNSSAALLLPAQIIEAVCRTKCELIELGKLPKQKKHAVVSEKSLPEAFTDASRFSPLGELARIEKGKTGIKQARPGPFPLVVTAADRTTCDHYDFEGSAAIVPLVSSTGHGNASLNRLHYQEGRFALGTILVGIFPHDPSLISARFLFEYLSAFKDELLVSRMTGTANVTLTVGGIAEVPVPLVSPEVQKKLDELMALCDQLEAKRAEREEKRSKFAAATLQRLNQPDDDPAAFKSHATFVLNNLQPLTSHPDQIKQIRRTIVELAIRGGLAPQTDEEGSGNDVVVGVQLEKQRLISCGELRKEKPLEVIGENEPPHQIPSNWIWARIGAVTLFTEYGTSQKSAALRNGVPVLAMGNIQNGRVLWGGGEKSIPRSSNELPALFLKKNDLLYNRTNSAELVGKTGIYCGEDDRHTFASYLIRVRCVPQLMCPFYMNLAMGAPSFRATQITPHIKKQTGQANVNGTMLKSMLVPVPPPLEQSRIVAKVDKLMTLCDQLEASLVRGAETTSRLLEATLHEALNPSGALMEAAE